MSDLESSILNWRQSFGGELNIATEDIAELEAHLRESIEDLQETGLNDNEAFTVATMRLGRPSQLLQEFQVAPSSPVWQTRAAWMLMGYLAFFTAATLIAAFSSVAATSMAISGLGTAATGTAAISFTVLGWVTFFAVLYSLLRKNVLADTWVPLRWLGIITVLIVVALATRQGAVIFEAKAVGAAEMGKTIIWRTIGNFAVQTTLLLTCGLAVWWLSRPRNAAAKIQRS